MIRWLVIGLLLGGCAAQSIELHPWLLCKVLPPDYFVCKPIPPPEELQGGPAKPTLSL